MKAILLAVFIYLVIGPIFVGIMVYAPLPQHFNIALPFLLGIAFLVAIIRDATRTAREQRNSYHLKSYNKWYVYLSFGVLCGFVIQPTGSGLAS